VIGAILQLIGTFTRSDDTIVATAIAASTDHSDEPANFRNPIATAQPITVFISRETNAFHAEAAFTSVTTTEEISPHNGSVLNTTARISHTITPLISMRTA